MSRLQNPDNQGSAKAYFHFILHAKYIIKVNNYEFENLELLSKYRNKDKIILLSSNPFRIVTALTNGFQAIPVLPFESLHQNDFQIALVENYILKSRHLN